MYDLQGFNIITTFRSNSSGSAIDSWSPSGEKGGVTRIRRLVRRRLLAIGYEPNVLPLPFSFSVNKRLSQAIEAFIEGLSPIVEALQGVWLVALVQAGLAGLIMKIGKGRVKLDTQKRRPIRSSFRSHCKTKAKPRKLAQAQRRVQDR